LPKTGIAKKLGYFQRVITETLKHQQASIIICYSGSRKNKNAHNAEQKGRGGRVNGLKPGRVLKVLKRKQTL